MSQANAYPRFDTLYQLANEGRDQFIGRMTNGQGSGITGGILFTGKPSTIVSSGTNPGAVAIVTRIMITTQGAATTSTQVNDTTDLLLVDQDGVTRSTLPFLTPHRNPAIYSPVVTQTLPDGTIVWQPVTPLVVPAGWTLQAVCDATQSCEALIFGFKLTDFEARALGFDVNNVGSPTTSHLWFAEGAKPSSDTTTVLVARRSGYALRIDDIVMRMMPAVATGTVATVKLQRSDGVSLFEWGCNGDNGEPITKIIRGPFYVDPNDGTTPSSTYSPIGTAALLTASFGLNVTSTNCAGRFTIVVKGAYIPFKDVPDDWWWSRITPSVPTPGTGLIVAAANLAGNAVPTTVKALPGKGRQIILEGLDFCAGKDATVASGTVCAILGAGNAADGAGVGIISGSAAFNSALIPLLPLISMNSHNQRKNLTIDRVNMPCGDNRGLFFETGTYNFLNAVVTPVSATTGDFDHISLTCWGRIRPSTKTNQGTSNEGLPYLGV